MKEMYNTLRHYGEIIADKEHETTEGMFIRFTTYKYEEQYYIVIMADGNLMAISETNNVHNLVKQQEETKMSEHLKNYYEYKRIKYENILKNSQKTIDKSTEVCYNKGTK